MQLPTIGVDLGTTYSRVGVFRNGCFEIIEDNYGKRKMPSIVAFNGEYRLVGNAATDQLEYNYMNTVIDVKKVLGRNFIDDKRRKTFKLKYRKEDDYFQPEEIAAFILASMKTNAEKHLGGCVKSAVITVPASFNDSQRYATMNACKIAGFEEIRLLNEPTATAIAYGFDKQGEGKKNILVYDLGGGTFDVTILTVDNGTFDVKSTAGDVDIGGLDFTERLVNYFARDVKNSWKMDLRSITNPVNEALIRQKLHTTCESAKKKLSFQNEASISVDLTSERSYTRTINLERFESLCQDLFNETLQLVEQALMEAGMEKNEIDDVVIVGGSTRIPKIQKMLSDFFDGKILSKSIDTDEAVVRGAAIRAAAYDEERLRLVKSVEVHDVSCFTLNWQVDYRTARRLIKKNDKIPIKFAYEIPKGSSEIPSTLISIFEMFLKSKTNESPPCIGWLRFKECNNIIIRFGINPDGMLEIKAYNRDTRKILNTKDWRVGLKGEEVEMMVGRMRKFEEEDMMQNEKNIAKNQLEELIFIVKNTLREKQRTSNDDRLKKLKKLYDETTKWFREERKATKDDYVKIYSQLYQALDLLRNQSKECTYV